MDATTLANETLLTLSGLAVFSVTGLQGNLNASGLGGALTVTTVDAFDNTITITTGSAQTSINDNFTGDTVTVHAAQIADNTLLTLSGAANFVVDGLRGDLDVSGVTGTLSLTLGNAPDNNVTITIGPNATSITSNFANDTVTVNATALQDDTLLTLSGSADFIVTGLQGDLNASGVTGSLTVTTADNTVDNAISITTGTNTTSIAGSTLGDLVAVNATALQDDRLLTLSGLSGFDVTGLVGNLDASGLSGALSITTGNVPDNNISITTGSGATSITDTFGDNVAVNAAALANGTVLTLEGSANFTVTGLKGDLNAVAVTGTLTVTTGDNTVDSTITITTGSSTTSITGSALGDTVTVHAAQLVDNTQLTLTGASNFVVDGLQGNINASTLAGTLTVTTADALDDAISITTGSNTTSIAASGSNDIVSVNATALTNNTLLTLSGSAAFTVTGLKGDLNASALTGTLSISTNNAPGDNAISITTGSNTTSITHTFGSDTITVNATALDNGKLLTLAGPADFDVSGLQGDLNASGVTGILEVITADASDGTISITTGSNTTSITDSAADDTVSVNAAQLANNKLLTLSGSAAFSVTGLRGNIDASTLAGTLTVITGDSGTISIITGSAATSITDSFSGNTVTVNATALAEDTGLTLVGAADFVVTALRGDLVASGVAGDLNVTTVDVVTGLSITTGSGGGNTINATALADGHVLTLFGSDSATVSLHSGDLLADTYSGTLTVNVVTNGAGTDTVSITTGINTTSITAADAGDAVTVNATALPDNTQLTLSGAANFTVTGLQGNLVASGVSGTLTVTTADALDEAISITTGSNTTSIAGSTAGDMVTVNAAQLANNTLLTLSGAANFTVTGLQGNLNASTLAGTLTVTTGDASDGSITITTGSSTTSITGTAGNDTVTVNATTLNDGTTLTLIGPADFVVTGLQGDLIASGVTGALNVTTVDVAGLTITTGGGGGNTVTATALADGHVLTLIGSDSATVSLSAGDLLASTYSGVLTVNVVTNGVGTDTVSITTGTSTTSITAADIGDAVAVNATAITDNTQLTLSGSANFTVTGLQGNLNASGVGGTLTVTTANATDDAISITTGSNTTSITGSTLGDMVTVTATALPDNTQLTLSGAANFTVTGLQGNLNAGGVSGTLTVTTANAADDAISITTGSNTTTIAASGSGDAVAVNATALPDNTQLTLSGSANFTVTGLQGNLVAGGVSGTLTVTTANATDDAISITTGSSTTSIAGSTAGDMVTVNAAQLANNTLLTLSGAANFTVTGLQGNLNASTLAGTLTVTTGDASDGSIAITTGSSTTSITGTAGNDTVTVNATTLNDGTTLTLIGPADFTVTGLQGDLVASGVTGALNVTTVDVATGLSITTGGGGGNTINATALTDSHALTLIGSDGATVSLTSGDLLAGTYSGTLTVNVVTNGLGTDTVSITTGTSTTSITAADAGDAITVNATALPDNTQLTLSGAANFTVTGLQGNLIASGVSGTLTVTTADAIDNAISITTGSNTTSITGSTLGDMVTVTATALPDNTQLTLSGAANFTVTGLQGNLNASGVSGTLTVTTANAADDAISITTGSNTTTIAASGSGDAVAVNATALPDNTQLTLSGSANFTVTGLQGNLNAGGVSGTLTVTTANATDDTISITTGSNTTSIAGSTAGDMVTVNAAQLANNTLLTLSGAANFTVTGLKGNLNASTLAGTLDRHHRRRLRRQHHDHHRVEHHLDHRHGRQRHRDGERHHAQRWHDADAHRPRGLRCHRPAGRPHRQRRDRCAECDHRGCRRAYDHHWRRRRQHRYGNRAGGRPCADIDRQRQRDRVVERRRPAGRHLQRRADRQCRDQRRRHRHHCDHHRHQHHQHHGRRRRRHRHGERHGAYRWYGADAQRRRGLQRDRAAGRSRRQRRDRGAERDRRGRRDGPVDHHRRRCGNTVNATALRIPCADIDQQRRRDRVASAGDLLAGTYSGT